MAKAKIQKTTKKDEAANLRALKSDLQSFGYLLPTNDEELEEFEKMFGKTQVLFPDRLKNPVFLNKESKKSYSTEPFIAKDEPFNAKAISSTTPGKKNDYFKKLVLAAEIANQLHSEPTFGHVKFVKITYLCNQVCNMRLNVNYGRYAAGPLDPKLMYTVDAEFRRRKWFNVLKSKSKYGGYKYYPGENINDYKIYFSRYYHSQINQINSLIELFRDKKSDFCEIVATVYFLWQDFKTKNKLINNASLIRDFYDWDTKKKRFSESEIIKTIEWMTDNEIVPKSK